jgi:hypothetical protein
VDVTRAPRSVRDALARGAGMPACAIAVAAVAASGRFRTISRQGDGDVAMRFARLLECAAPGQPVRCAALARARHSWDAAHRLTLKADLGALAGGIGAFAQAPTVMPLSPPIAQAPWLFG